MILNTKVLYYAVFLGPLAIFVIISYWNKLTKIDFILRMSCVAFIASLMSFLSIKWLLP